MSTIDSNALVSFFQSQQTSATPNAYSDLTSEQFVKIMFTELSNQDPLKPNDSNQILQQMSSLRSIQSDLELSNKLSAVVTQNQLATAGAMLGKLVSGLSENGEPVAGIVKSVSNTAHGPVLTLDNGHRVPFDFIDKMLEPPPAPTSTNTNTNTNTNTDTGTPTGSTTAPAPTTPPAPGSDAADAAPNNNDATAE